MNSDLERPVELHTAIELQKAEIVNHARVLIKYQGSRWYNQSKEFGELLQRELALLESYIK